MTSEFPVLPPPPSKLLRRLVQFPAWIIFRLWGWKIVGPVPNDIPKHILVGAYHTSNTDGILTVLMALAAGYNMSFIMKAEAFEGFRGPLVRALGAIPIDRATSMNTVEVLVNSFNTYDELAIAISPEATRRKRKFWRSGFYVIAKDARVPIVMVAADYGRKEFRFSEAWMPSGDLEADTPRIKAFYADVTAHVPENATPVNFKPASLQRRLEQRAMKMAKED